MSAPADHPRHVEKAEARSEIWKYFTYVADSKGKPTDTTMPVCKRCFKSEMTKGANTSVSLCSVTVCHCETTPTLAAGSEEAERSCTHRHAAPLSHKVHQLLILIKREKVLFLTAAYRGAFLVSVYRATLTPYML